MISLAHQEIIVANWIGSMCKAPLTSENVNELVDSMLDQLSPFDHKWLVQAKQLLLTEAFLSSIFFFIDDSMLEGLIGDTIIPCLLHQHPDVQDSASQLLTFVVKSSSQLSPKLPSIVHTFITMLQTKEQLNYRVAGAKGLSSIISGTILFDEVPQYVIDAFSALTEALEMDSSVESVITQFLSDTTEI